MQKGMEEKIKLNSKKEKRGWFCCSQREVRSNANNWCSGLMWQRVNKETKRFIRRKLSLLITWCEIEKRT